MKSELLKRVISSIILIPLVFFLIIKGSIYFYLLLIVTFIIGCYEWHLMSRQKPYYLFGFIFLTISFFCFYKLRINTDNSYIILLLITSICILTDIGGFIFGKIIGGPKLTKYSPKKTYAGMIGSYVLSLSIIPIILKYNLINIEKFLVLVFLVIIVSTISQCGDIIVSYFKRISKIKDTGKIIPGHGGLLDRIDGMIFAYPFSYLLILTNSLINI